MNEQSKQNYLHVKAPYDYLLKCDYKDEYGYFLISDDGKVYKGNEKEELLSKEITEFDMLYSVYDNTRSYQKDFEGFKKLGEIVNDMKPDVIRDRLKKYQNNSYYASYDKIYKLLGKKDADGKNEARGYISQLSVMVKDITNSEDKSQMDALKAVISAHIQNPECLGDLFGHVSAIDSDIRKKYLNSLAQVMADEIIRNNKAALDKAYSENGQSEWEKISYHNVHWQEGIFNHLLDQYHINDIRKKPTEYFNTISNIATPFINKALENINDETKKSAIHNIATNYDISQLKKGLEKIALQSILPEDYNQYPPGQEMQKLIHDGLVIGLDNQFTDLDLPDTLVLDAKRNAFLQLQDLEKQNEKNRQATLKNLHDLFGATKVVDDRPNKYHIWNSESLLNHFICGNEQLLFNHDLIATIKDDGKLRISRRDGFWSNGLTESQMTKLQVEQNGKNYIHRKVNNEKNNVFFI